MYIYTYIHILEIRVSQGIGLQVIMVGGLEHVLIPFSSDIIIPSDFHIVQRGKAQPLTRQKSHLIPFKSVKIP